MKRKNNSKEGEIIKCPRCDSTRLKLMKPVFSMPDYKCRRCKKVFKIIRANGNEIEIIV